MTQVPYETIVVGVDFSANAKRALAHARQLARALEARLEVVHVVAKLKPAVPFSRPNRQTVARLQAEAQSEARARLQKLVKDVGADVRTRVLSGTPSAALVAHAERRNADLIVLGERGQNLAEALLIGSTAERVARRSTIPVLLIPDKHPDR